jgi:hypothetical protein
MGSAHRANSCTSSCCKPIEPAGRLMFFERRESVAFRLERGAQTIEGYLWDLTHDSLALKLSWPTPTGCIRRRIWAPYENGYLIDTEGRLNEFGLRIAVELVVVGARDLCALRSDQVGRGVSVEASARRVTL